MRSGFFAVLLCWGAGLLFLLPSDPRHKAAFFLQFGVFRAFDILYWLVLTMLVFARIYQTNQGILRNFLFFGLLSGAFLHI